MAGPRRKYRERPVKRGAKKRTRVKAQKKRLLESGCKEEEVAKLSPKETRGALKKVSAKKK